MLPICLCLVGLAGAQQNPAAGAPHSVPRTDLAITVDGELDEAAWQQALSLWMEYEVRPGENVPPPVRTEVLITYDDGNVYFAFRAFDPEPDQIRAHLSDRDNVGSDDWVAVILDTFNDERRSFGFLVNPLGVQEDFVETSNGGGGSWDTIWDSAGQITDWGFAVEMKIPFSSFRFQRVNGPQIWGFDGVRSYSRSQRHHIGLFPRDRANNCYLCQAVKLEGFSGVTPGRNLEVVPTLTAVRTDTRDDLPDGDWSSGDEEVEAGITARWGITPNLTLAGTINPDFSQIEADARQLDINEPFALFFSEKRPFFMEGADFFSTRLNAVYTRMMRDPSWGLKLTGKEGEHTIGAYVVRDEVTNFIFPGNQGSEAKSLERASTATVLRYKRDLGNRFTLGTLFTDRKMEGYSGRVLGIDGDLRLTDKDLLRFQVMGSSTEYPVEFEAEFDQPGGTLKDWAGDIFYIRDTRNLDFWGRYRHVGRDFRADLGFMPMVDYDDVIIGSEYEWIPEGKTWYSALELEGEFLRRTDSDGDLLLQQSSLSFTYEGPLQSHSVIRLTFGRERYGAFVFDQDELFVHTCMRPNGDAHIYLNLTWGDRIDYTNIRPGRRAQYRGGLVYKLGRHARVDVSHHYERMTVTGAPLFTANISQATLAYQFTTRSFVRAILQHVDYGYNTALYTDDRDPEYRHLFSQFLFSYKINPQTVFFLGYTDNSEANQDYGLASSDRTIFAKVGYAWTF